MKLHLIRDIVEQTGFTQKELCEKIGMTYQNLHRCIKDNRITANDLEKISSVLDVPVCIFFDESNNPNCILKYKDGVLKKSHLALENENRNQQLANYKKEVEHLSKEIKLKDRIIELLEAK